MRIKQKYSVVISKHWTTDMQCLVHGYIMCCCLEFKQGQLILEIQCPYNSSMNATL